MSFPFIKFIHSLKGPSTVTQLGYQPTSGGPSIISGQMYMFQSDKYLQAGAGALSQTCVGVKWRCQNATRPVGDHWVISYYGNPSVLTSPIAGVLARDDGSFEIWQRESGHVAMLASTAAGVWNLSTDYTVEFRYTGAFSASGGYDLRVYDGATLVASLTASSIVTEYSAGIASWVLGPADTGTPFDINDYFWDIVVSSRSSTTPIALPGVCTFYQLRPTANGSSADFTPNTGTNYAAVDDTVVDLDATFVALNTSGTARDSYVMSDLPPGAPPIAAVAPCSCIRSLNNGVWSVSVSLYSGGSYTNIGSSFGINALTTPTYKYYGGAALPSYFGTDWTASQLNGAEMGLVATLSSGTPLSGPPLSQFYLDVCCAGVPAATKPGYAMIVG